MIISSYKIQKEIIIRECQEDDLGKLEWFGQFYEHREIIKQTFQKFINGTNYFLIAEFNNFPIGQVWIDFKKKEKRSTGIIWALRVLEPFQGLGIGKRMLSHSEGKIWKRGLRNSELNVEKSNTRARKLYENCGYLVTGEEINESSYTNPNNELINYVSEQWIMDKKLGIQPKSKMNLIKIE